MAFRRFNRFRARRRFTSRRRSNLRRPHPPKKYSRANFYVSTTVAVANQSDNTTNTAVLLARTLNLGELAGAGRSFSDQVRGIEIGGVVLDYGITEGVSDFMVNTWPNVELYSGVTLLSDRLDATGAPVAAASVQWNRVQPPIAQTTAATPSSTAEDVDFPLQIHWRRFQPWRRRAQALDAPVEGELYGIDGQFLQMNPTTLNKRLKLWLDDYHGLFFQFSFITGPAYAAGFPRTFHLFLQGQLYYRTRF